MFKLYLNALECYQEVWAVDASGLGVSSRQAFCFVLQTCPQACGIHFSRINQSCLILTKSTPGFPVLSVQYCGETEIVYVGGKLSQSRAAIATIDIEL